MNTPTDHTINAARIVLLGAFLTLGLGSGYQAASACYASILAGSGYASECAIGVDYPVLIGSGYERHDAMAAQGEDTASTHEDVTTPGVASTDSILIGSGYEGHVAVTTVEEPIASHGAQPR